MTTATSPLAALAVDGDYGAVLWLDIDGLSRAPRRFIIEMRRQGETWSLKTSEYSDGDEFGPQGIGPALVALEGQTGRDPLDRLVALLMGRPA
jgi:hypothetical protein